MLGEVQGLLFSEKLKNIAIRTELNVDAGLLGSIKVDKLSLVGEVVDALLESRELIIEGVKFDITARGSIFDSRLAKFADVVILCKEVVCTKAVGYSGDSSKGEGAHFFLILIRY